VSPPSLSSCFKTCPAVELHFFFWISFSIRNWSHIATLLILLLFFLFFLRRPCLKKAEGSVVWNRIGMKFGRIVLQVVEWQESDLWYVILVRRRPWRPPAACCCICSSIYRLLTRLTRLKQGSRMARVRVPNEPATRPVKELAHGQQLRPSWMHRAWYGRWNGWSIGPGKLLFCYYWYSWSASLYILFEHNVDLMCILPVSILSLSAGINCESLLVMLRLSDCMSKLYHNSSSRYENKYFSSSHEQ